MIQKSKAVDLLDFLHLINLNTESMNILEKDLEEIIEKASFEELYKKGIYLQGICKRQLKIGNYGVADLIYFSRDYDCDYRNEKYINTNYLNINICELKKDKAGISAFLQAVRYAKGIQHYLEKRKFYNFKIEITLIAPKIDTSSDYIFLTDLISSNVNGCINKVNNYSFKYCLNGIEFQREERYYLSNTGF